MRVTDEMVEVLARELPVYRAPRIRSALEAALAPVPEPTTLADYLQGRKDEYEHNAARIAELEATLEIEREGGTPGRNAANEERYQAAQRVYELEAKLQRVRAWAERDSERADVLDILDGKSP